MLEAEGYTVFKAYNGVEGLALAKEEHPDLMILDVMMTSTTEGLEVSRKIPEIPELKNIQVILVTGVTQEMNLPFKLEPDDSWLPVACVMEKPIDHEKLIKEISERLK